MNTNRLFELFARYGWPVVRPFVRKSTRCKACILSDKYSVLKNGLCAECLKDQRSTLTPCLSVSAETREQFESILRSHAADTGQYHALLLLSGGKDSAYILHTLSRDFPRLNVLCVTVNNGFMSSKALANVSFLSHKLNKDLLVVNSHQDKFSTALRQAFLALKGHGSYGIVDKADGDLIFEIGRALAAEMKIPLVLAGLTWVQLKRIFGTDDFKLNQKEGVLSVFPLAVWRPSEEEIKTIVRKFNLMLPGSDSPITSNNSLILPMSVLDILNQGYCSFEPEFAQLVREGKADRKTWLYTFELLEFAARRGLLAKDLQAELGKLNLTVADILRGPS